MAIPGLPTIDNLSGEDMAKAILEMAVGRRPQDMQFDMTGDGELSAADAYSYLKQFKAAAPQTAPQPQPLMQNLGIQAGLNQYNPVNTQAFQDQQQRVGQASTSMNMTSDVLTPPTPLPNVYTPPPIDMTGRMTMAEQKAARMAELGMPYQPEPVSNLTPDQMGQQMQQQAAAMAKGATQPTASTEEMLARAEAQGLNAAMGPVNDTSGFLSDFTGQEAIRQGQSGTTPLQPVRQPYDNYAVQQKMAEQNALLYPQKTQNPYQRFQDQQQQLQAQQLRFQQQFQRPFQQTNMYAQNPQVQFQAGLNQYNQPQSFSPTPVNQQNLLGQGNPFNRPRALPLRSALNLAQQNNSPMSPFSTYASPFGQQSNTQTQQGQQGGQMNTAPAPRSMARGIL